MKKIVHLHDYKASTKTLPQSGSYRKVIAGRAELYAAMRDRGMTPQEAAEQVIKESFPRSEGYTRATAIVRFREAPEKRGLEFPTEGHLFAAAMACCLGPDIRRYDVKRENLERIMFEAIDSQGKYLNRNMDEKPASVGMRIINAMERVSNLLKIIFPEEELPRMPRDFY